MQSKLKYYDMARDFTKNNANYLSYPVNTLSGLINGVAVVSVFAWVYADTVDAGTNENRILSIPVANSSTGLALLITNPGGTPLLRCGGRSVSTDGFQARNATTTFTTGVWHSCGAVYNYPGDTISPYYDGNVENSGAATFANASFTSAPPTTSRDAIGSGTENPVVTTIQFDGRIAEVAIWSGDIGAAGYATLHKGISPLLVRPELLLFHAPLIGNFSPEIDLISAKAGTITGSLPASGHPRIYLPSKT